MEPARYRLLKELFAEASALPEEERRAYLERACCGDDELRRELEELLASEAASRGGALGRALEEAPVQEPPSSQLGLPERIGGYRVLRVCGYGGMGIVYEAEQDAPRRRVALKVVQAGTRRREALSRFRREVEILGRLQHPGIGQVYEAGEFVQEGRRRPFFAMEYVEGLPLTEYGRRSGLDVDARVELFTRVCDAVEYAHGQGVVHRDLKPDNVLVVEPSAGGLAQPKVLDFGVARLTDSDLRATVATGAGELLGSVPYMSPEQAAGRPEEVDARSDVHALGALLFELLTDRLPYELAGRPLADALDTIRRAEPARLGAVRPELRGELETIVGKCLEKEPARRYPSVAALSEELRRYLRREPIAARPPSTWYQLRRFARRHRAVVGGAAATLLALVAGLVVSVVLAIEAKRNEELAERARDASAREAYRANLAATSALLERDPLAARASLEAVEPARRGWEWRYLDGQLASHLFELEREGVRAGPLVASSGGRRLAALRDEVTLGVWDLERGVELERVAAPEPASAWAVSPDGRAIAAGTSGGRVLVRDAVGEWRTWYEGAAEVAALAFDPPGERLAIVAGAELIVGRPQAWLRAGQEPASPRSLVGFSPDGARVLTLTAEFHTRLRLWDARTLEELATRSCADSPRCFAFSPDGALLALGEAYHEIELADARDLSPLRTLLGHKRLVRHVEFDAQGRLLSASEDGTVRVWSLDVEGGERVLAEPGVLAATFAGPDRVVSATPDGLRLWSLDTERARVLDGHASYVYELAFSGDGALLAAYVHHGGELSVWDPARGELLLRRDVAPYSTRLGFDPSGGSVWLGAPRRTERRPWSDAAAATESIELLPTFGHRRDTGLGRIDLEQAVAELVEDEGRLAIHRTVHGLGPDARGVEAWRDGAPLELREREPARGGVDLGEHPRLYVGGLADRPWFDLLGHLAELLIYEGRLSEPDAAAVEAYLAARRAGEPAELPAVSSARLLARFRADEASVERDAETLAVSSWRAANDPALRLVAHGAPRTAIRFRPADGELACATLAFGPRGRERYWLEAPFPQARGALPLTVLWLGDYARQRGSSFCYAIDDFGRANERWRDPRVRRLGTTWSYSADGRRVACGGLRSGMPALVRDAATGEVLRELGEQVLGVALSPDGTLLAGGDAQGRVNLWSVESGELVAVADDPAGEVYAVAFSPDGTRVASGGNDGAVVLREATTLEPLLELRGHRQYVKSLAFSPDGTMLASASGDRTVRVWDSLPPAERRARRLVGSTAAAGR